MVARVGSEGGGSGAWDGSDGSGSRELFLDRYGSGTEDEAGGVESKGVELEGL